MPLLYKRRQYQSPALFSPSGGGGGSTLKTGLISLWEFENTSWTDSHGSNTLTANGSPTSTTGVVGNAFDTNLGLNYLTHTSNSDLQVGGQDFSVSVWIHRGDTGFTRDIVNKRTGGAGNQEFEIYANGGGAGHKVGFNIFDSFSFADTVTSTADVINDGWHLMVCTFNASTGVMTLSIDAGTRDTFTSSKTVPSTSADLTIGNGSNNGWHDKLDQLGFWKKVLTTTEETQLYNSGAGLSYASM